MKDLRDYARETVLYALSSELGLPSSSDELRDRADAFIAIAEENGLPIEGLLTWIHTTAPEKEWSLAEFRGYCRFWKRLRDNAFPPASAAPLSATE